jgi:NADH-quinone oxidoreductase subunit J
VRVAGRVILASGLLFMSLPVISFLALSLLTLVSAALVITRKNPVHSIVWLIVTLFSVGGLYLLLHAEFLFAVQIILYVGGIMVLFLFVVMLVNVDVAVRASQFSRQWLVASITATVLLAELIYGFVKSRGLALPAPSGEALALGNTQGIADSLFRTYMLPTEIASILLLVAMVGAVIMAKRNVE